MWWVVVPILILVLLFRPKYKEPEVLRGVLTDEECEYIKTISKEKLKPSTVGHDFTEDHDIRKSETAWLDHGDPVIKRIITKCVDDTSVCERLQVVRYTPGGFYIPHHDANPTEPNTRKHTFIFILNDDYEGGDTVFPFLEKSYRLNKGDILSFDTLDSWGRVPHKALHGGEPITSGEKWIANLWVRSEKYIST